MRLDKLVSSLGLTRSEAKKAIAAGRVTLNGAIVRDPGADAEKGDYLFDGRPLSQPREMTIMLHKPAGIVSATRDNKYEDLYRLLPEDIVRRRPGPCGRLDVDVTGLILMTTDGQLAHRLISPKKSVRKVYIAVVEGRFDEECAAMLEKGVEFRDYTSLPVKSEILSANDSESTVRLTLTEGKYHEVKKLCAKTGHEVLRLSRVSEGGVELGDLPVGQWRMLTEEELTALYEAAGMKYE